MKETLLQFARYNAWANNRIIEAMLQLDAADVDKGVVSSFPSLRKTVYHTWSAEHIWLQRLELAEHPVWMEAIFEGSFQQACDAWARASSALESFIERQTDDRAFVHVLQYYSRDKKSFKDPVQAVLMHCFNHSTFHRGQLITMLRQLGAAKIPGTDYIAFVRK